MKINSNFTVVANCVNLGLIDQTKEDKLTLLFDKEKALEFISRFNNNIIEVSSIVDGEEDNKCRISFRYNTTRTSCTILIDEILKDGKGKLIYIVKNHEQFINDIIEGYNKLCIIDKFSDILEFDFEAGIDIQK